MHTLLLLLLLALIQGLTEFLPISSSGHLVLVEAMVPSGQALPEGPAVEVMLHLGTLLAVLIYYRQRLAELLLGLVGRGSDPRGNRRLIGLLFLGSLPVAICGLLFREQFHKLYDQTSTVCMALIATGLVLAWTARIPKMGRRAREVTVRMAILIGLAQVLALIPGISRSGVTIAAALALGLSGEAAATFSFLLSIPAVAGAGLLEALSGDATVLVGYSTGALITATLVSTVVGLASLGLLVRILRGNLLHRFAPYCLAVGTVGMLLFLSSS